MLRNFALVESHLQQQHQAGQTSLWLVRLIVGHGQAKELGRASSLPRLILVVEVWLLNVLRSRRNSQ